jgi:hypothetical protein
MLNEISPRQSRSFTRLGFVNASFNETALEIKVKRMLEVSTLRFQILELPKVYMNVTSQVLGPS